MFSTTSNSIFLSFDKPYYTNSETVTGVISLNITLPFKSNALQMTIKAREGVKFYQYETQRIKTKFDEYRQVLIPKEQQTKLFTHKALMPVWKGEIIPVGQYTFPFSFVVPARTPGSFDYYSKEASIFVVYTAKAKIVNVDNADNVLKCTNVLMVRQHAKELEYSKIRQNSKTLTTCGCCSQGKMAMDVTFTKDNFTLNDTVTMNITLKNSDSSLPMQGMQMTLVQEIIVRGDKSVKSYLRELGKLNIKNGIEAGQIKATLAEIPIKDDENPTLKSMTDHKYSKCFTDDKIIAKFQACTKGQNVICRYNIITQIIYSGSCIEVPVFRIPVLIYPPEEINQIQGNFPYDWKPQPMQLMELKYDEDSKMTEVQIIEYPDYYMSNQKIFAPSASAISQGNPNSSFNSGTNFNLNPNDDKDKTNAKLKEKLIAKDRDKDKKRSNPFHDDIEEDNDDDLRIQSKAEKNERGGKNKSNPMNYNNNNDYNYNDGLGLSDKESERKLKKNNKNNDYNGRVFDKKPSRKYNNDSDDDNNKAKPSKYYEGDDDNYNDDKFGINYIDNNLSQTGSVMNFESGVPVPQRKSQDETMSIRDTD